MAGLLDFLNLGSGGGGLLDAIAGYQQFPGSSGGFSPQPSPLDNAQWPYGPVGAPSAAPPASSFAERFGALPGAPQQPVFADRFNALPNADAPAMATPMNIGGYQMPRLGSEAQYAAIPQNAQPAQGQLPPQVATANAQMSQQMPEQLPPALGGNGGGIGSILGRIGNPDGLIARLTGNDSRSIAQQNLQAQYQSIRQALIANGENPQTASSKAMIAAMNPEAAKTIIPELFTTKEKFQKTGQDPFTGVEQYGFVNERDQTVNGKPIGAGGANPSQGALGDPNLTGDAYLQSLPEAIRSQVKAIVEGRMQPPSGFALKSPQVQALVRAAAQYEPGFDLTKWGSRAATAKDFSSGMAAKNVTSLNTVIGHLGDLKKTAEALDNWQVPTVNEVGNMVNNATGDPKVNNFNLARNAVADELAKVFKGSGISDHEIAQWKSTLNASQSPAQLKGAVKTAISLMESRLSALNDQRDRGMATQSEPRSLLNEKSQKALKEVEDWANGSASANKSDFKEGATATNPKTGQTITFRNGKWQ